MEDTNTFVRLLGTPFLDLVEVNYIDHNKNLKKWYGVTRVNDVAAVEVAAVTPNNEIIFVKQYRPLVGSYTLELTAGLMDIPGESACETATRELLEETGYAGDPPVHILGAHGKGHVHSSGLTNERLHLVMITNAQKVAEPYTNERTEPILVPLSNALQYLAIQQRFTDIDVNYQLYGTICLIQNILKGE